MAVSIDGGGGDRKKPLHAELNLVPYIDLLTCMVAFLLITAVWTQLARLRVDQHGQGPGEEGVSDAFKIAVVVHDDGFNLIVGNDQKPLPTKAGELDYATLATELAAVKRLFGNAIGKVSMSSTKSAIGHLLGGAGAVEAIFCILAIRDQIVPPTLNLDNPSEGTAGVDLVPHQAKKRPVRAALNNSFGFGGTNASLVVKAVN